MKAESSETRGVVVTCPACGQVNAVPYEHLEEAAVSERCGVALPLQSVPIKIEDEVQFDRLIRSSALPVVVDFWAPSCGPCQEMAPELEKAAIGESGSVVVAKVNAEQVPSVADRYEILNIPTLALFVAGQLVDQASDLLPASGIQAFAKQSLCELIAPEVARA